MRHLKVGIVGCGNISRIYCTNIPKISHLELFACTDIDLARAQATAEEHGIPHALPVDDLLSHEEIDLVLNLTIPSAHSEIALKAISSGKSVYGEKPLAVEREDGKKIIDEAKTAGVLAGSAPDTFYGAGHQNARKLIDDGEIGQPLAAVAFMAGLGPERWHPNPQFFYQWGGGPLFDMGPYYITDLVQLFGPVKKVSSMNKASYKEREVGSGAMKGETFPVDVPTYCCGTLEFHNGAIATLITSFETGANTLPRIQVYGSEGSLQVPDPNGFGGAVLLRRHEHREWRDIASPFANAKNGRGLGLADIGKNIIEKTSQHRASADLAYHVLDIMHTIYEASDQEKHLEVKSTVERPSALPTGLGDFEL